MGRGLIFFGFVFLMLVLPMTLAAEINVRTVSGHRASITLLGAGETYEFLDSFHLDTGDNGMVKVEYTGGKEAIDVLVKISKDGETIVNERFEEMNAAEPMYLQVIPGKISKDYLKLDEEKARAEEERLAKLEAEKAEVANPEVTDDGNKGVTGSAISDYELKIPKSLYYIVGGLLVVGLLAFLGLKYGDNLRGLGPGKPVVSVASASNTGSAKDPAEERLIAQLKEAQKEIARLKREEENITKIVEMEKKLEADKEELRKLRSGQ